MDKFVQGTEYQKPANIRHLTPHANRNLLVATFVVYLGVVAAVTIVPIQITRFHWLDSNHVNLVPLRNSLRCGRYALDARSGLRSFCLINLIGNVALFLPLGLLLPWVSSRLRLLRQILPIALGMSFGIELIQFALRFVGNPRTVDIDDVILNTLGAGLGFVIYRLGNRNQ